MRCYMSKQSIARFCFLGGVLFVMLSLLPFPHKEDKRMARSYQSEPKPGSSQGSHPTVEKSKSENKNSKPVVVFEMKDNNKQAKPDETDKKTQINERENSNHKKEDSKSDVKQSDNKKEKSTNLKIEDKSSEKKVDPVKVKVAELKPGESNKAGIIQTKAIDKTIGNKDEKKKLDTDKQEISKESLTVKTNEAIKVTDKAKEEHAKIQPISNSAAKVVKDEKETKGSKQSVSGGPLPGTSDAATKVKLGETSKPADKSKQEIVKKANEKSQQKTNEKPKIKTDKPSSQNENTATVVNKPTQRKVQSIPDDNSEHSDFNPKKDNKTESTDTIYPKKISAVANVHIQPVVIPESSKLKLMGQSELEELFFLYIENLQTHCVRQRHVGNQELGGYHICEDAIDFKPCLVYSFGKFYWFCGDITRFYREIKIMSQSPDDKDSTFEKEMAQRYGCEVHAFDRTSNKDVQLSPNVSFHDQKIGEQNLPREKIFTLSTLKAKVGHQQRQINILQMDIDHREWAVLDEILNGTELNGVSLLLVEFHLCSDDCSDLKATGQESYVRYLTLLKRLYDKGFRIYFFKMWSSCSYYVDKRTRIACHDIHMIRRP